MLSSSKRNLPTIFKRLFVQTSVRQYTNSSGYVMDSGNWALPKRHATTILCVKKDGKVTMIGDGQVSQGSIVVKGNAVKVRRIGNNVVAGFAGTTADCLALRERLEEKLDEYPGQLLRACVEMAKLWRLDKYLRHLEAVMIVADPEYVLEVTGNGDVIECNDGVMAIGSGGHFALAAARALSTIDSLTADEIAHRSMKVAADMCTMTNHNWIVERIDVEEAKKDLELEERRKRLEFLTGASKVNVVPPPAKEEEKKDDLKPSDIL